MEEVVVTGRRPEDRSTEPRLLDMRVDFSEMERLMAEIGSDGLAEGGGEASSGATQPSQGEKEEESTLDKTTRCASAQLGLDEMVAAGAAVSGFNVLETRGKFAEAQRGTSIASRVASAVFGQTRLPFRVPTIVGNPLTLNAGIRATSSVARIVGRGIPVIGWGVLAYDAAKIAQCVASDD
ncbi:MAG: hypothetical protein FJ191_10660 [Gammaproteobacteria bacterium]|nr:hypothetical protein [Gammaproteobacteria bacterium]